MHDSKKILVCVIKVITVQNVDHELYKFIVCSATNKVWKVGTYIIVFKTHYIHHSYQESMCLAAFITNGTKNSTNSFIFLVVEAEFSS